MIHLLTQKISISNNSKILSIEILKNFDAYKMNFIFTPCVVPPAP